MFILFALHSLPSEHFLLFLPESIKMTAIVEKDNSAVEEVTTSLKKTSVSNEAAAPNDAASDGRRVIFKNRDPGRPN